MDVKNLRNGKQGKTELVYVLETLARLGCPTKLPLNVYDHAIDNLYVYNRILYVFL